MVSVKLTDITIFENNWRHCRHTYAPHQVAINMRRPTWGPTWGSIWPVLPKWSRKCKKKLRRHRDDLGTLGEVVLLTITADINHFLPIFDDFAVPRTTFSSQTWKMPYCFAWSALLFAWQRLQIQAVHVVIINKPTTVQESLTFLAAMCTLKLQWLMNSPVKKNFYWVNSTSGTGCIVCKFPPMTNGKRR